MCGPQRKKQVSNIIFCYPGYKIGRCPLFLYKMPPIPIQQCVKTAHFMVKSLTSTVCICIWNILTGSLHEKSDCRGNTLFTVIIWWPKWFLLLLCCSFVIFSMYWNIMFHCKCDIPNIVLLLSFYFCFNLLDLVSTINVLTKICNHE